MNKDDLLAIAGQWSFWKEEPLPSVPRTIALPNKLQAELALVVQGVRRCGKSTLLSQLPARYGLDQAKCLFINFEDPRLSQAQSWEVLQSLVDAMESKVGKGCTFFFDEIQHVEGWQRWLRAQLDRPKDRRFLVTGSNSNLLAGELGSSLTGRYRMVELFPFNLGEYRLVHPDHGLEQYLQAGGFPAPTTGTEPAQLLRSYFNDIIERDVRERVGARSTRPLRQIAQMLFEAAGSEISLRRIAAATGISTDTTSVYVEAIESAYLAFACPYFAYSERKRSIRNKKYYPVDTGLRRATTTQAGRDLGKALESATFLELRRRFGQVSYWRGRGEVDFVVEHNGAARPIQVSWDGETERGLKALDDFYEQFPHAQEAVWVDRHAFEDGLSGLQL